VPGLGGLEVGDDDPGAVTRAVLAADADALVSRLPGGLDTELGTEFGGTEAGSHSELLAAGGRYAGLYGIQATAYGQ
jgi:ABC-type multidrug transport system fused ATPase/permease subunit